MDIFPKTLFTFALLGLVFLAFSPQQAVQATPNVSGPTVVRGDVDRRVSYLHLPLTASDDDGGLGPVFVASPFNADQGISRFRIQDAYIFDVPSDGTWRVLLARKNGSTVDDTTYVFFSGDAAQDEADARAFWGAVTRFGNND